MHNKMARLKLSTAYSLIFTLVLFQSLVTGSPIAKSVTKAAHSATKMTTGTALSPAPALNIAGLSVIGSVTMNGIQVTTGATVFNGGIVHTEENSQAILSVGGRGQIELKGNSDFVLKMDNRTVGGQLRSGRATFVAPAGVLVNVTTADGVVSGDGVVDTMVTVDVTAGKTRVETTGDPAHVKAPEGVESPTNAPIPAATTQSGNGVNTLIGGKLFGLLAAIYGLTILTVAGGRKGIRNSIIITTPNASPTQP